MRMSACAFAMTTVYVVLLSPNAVSRGQEPASAQPAEKAAAAPASDFLSYGVPPLGRSICLWQYSQSALMVVPSFAV